MKTVRLQDYIVAEIIPDYAMPVKDWYGEEFASNCIEAPDEVNQGWIFDKDKGNFSDPLVLTLEQIRQKILSNLDGMCSGAIYTGIDIGANHYNFSEKTQVNLETIARLIIEGQTTFLYRADNETEQRTYTANEMKVIIKAKSEWIAVNTNYYEQLKKWINNETETVVLESIHYGSALPNDLMQELATKLSSIGIDVTKYAAMFS